MSHPNPVSVTHCPLQVKNYVALSSLKTIKTIKTTTTRQHKIFALHMQKSILLLFFLGFLFHLLHVEF